LEIAYVYFTIFRGKIKKKTQTPPRLPFFMREKNVGFYQKNIDYCAFMLYNASVKAIFGREK